MDKNWDNYQDCSKKRTSDTRARKEMEHFAKAPKKPKRPKLPNESKRAQERDQIARYMKGDIDEFDFENFE